MISQNIAERPLDITSFLNSFKPFIKKSIKKNGGRLLTRKGNKRITSEQESAKRWKKYLHLKKKKPIDL